MRQLRSLLGEVQPFTEEPPSVATVCAWLASNLGTIRSKAVGHSRSSNSGDGMVTIMVALSDLQIAFYEAAAWFLEAHEMKPLGDTSPDAVAARIRPWIDSLAAWEPISEILDDLLTRRDAAAAVCPWAGIERDPDQAAVLLHLAPAETTDDICVRFSVTRDRIWKWHHRDKLHPINPAERPLRWMPWDVYQLLHPEAAKAFEARLATRG